MPGIFLIGYNVGTGSVTAMSKAGANFGMDLLWAVLVSCVITYYLMSLFSRYTMVTGQTAIEGFKRHIHPAFTIVLIVLLSVIIVSALMGVLSIIADVLHVWSQTVSSRGIPASVWAIVVASAIYFLLWKGTTAYYEKILAILVSIMGLAFLTTMLIEFPPPEMLLNGLIPKIPTVADGSDNNPFVIVAGMVGTTVSVFVFIIRTGLVREKGWTMKDCMLQRRDAAVSASLMFIISAAVMITAAATLNKRGLKLNNVTEMIPMLEPVFGKYALSVFVFGIVAAGLSSHLPNLLVIPWLIQDYRGLDRNTKTKGCRILFVFLSLASLFGVLFGFKPVFLMLLSQAAITVLLPLVIVAVSYLTSRKNIMGQHKNRIWDYGILAGIMVFALYMSSLGIRGLVADICSLSL